MHVIPPRRPMPTHAPSGRAYDRGLLEELSKTQDKAESYLIECDSNDQRMTMLLCGIYESRRYDVVDHEHTIVSERLIAFRAALDKAHKDYTKIYDLQDLHLRAQRLLELADSDALHALRSATEYFTIEVRKMLAKLEADKGK